MRLIDADDLKEQFREGAYTVKGIREEIDNAPTVEEITNEDIKTAIDAGFEDGYEMARAKFERPQGEWIDDNEEDSYYANCSHCGYQIDTHYERGYLNYCPNCGARMEVDNEAN